MFAFSSDQIALIRMTEPKLTLYEAMQAYEKEHPQEKKVGDFLSFLEDMRSKVADMPIHSFIEMLLQNDRLSDLCKCYAAWREPASQPGKTHGTGSGL